MEFGDFLVVRRFFWSLATLFDILGFFRFGDFISVCFLFFTLAIFDKFDNFI
jgi:hypothetical protein